MSEQAFHIVLTTHNSRTSQRMIDYKIKKGPSVELNLTNEIDLTQIIASIILENKYKCIAYNICKDHLHLILVCKYDKLNEIVKTIKGKSSFLFHKINYNDNDNGLKPIGESIGKSIGKPIGKPIGESIEDLIEQKTVGQKLWSQKYFRADLDVWKLATLSNRTGYIYKDTYLNNAINYILNNRVKHGLPKSEKLERIIETFVMKQDDAFCDKI